jgi:putative membrane protein insertion efficiency factor
MFDASFAPHSPSVQSSSAFAPANARPRGALGSLVEHALLAVISLYRVAISPLLGPHCRFEPSCSAYATEAIGRYGAARGAWLAILRVGRCHPFHPGGHDPVR